jgi:DNA-binding LytR/AlgR family response regulator
MHFKLICSKDIRSEVGHLLNRHGHRLDEEAAFVMVQNGFSMANESTGICFDSGALDTLEAFLEALDPVTVASPSDVLTVKTDSGEFKLIHLRDIRYFEALDKEVFCILKDGRYLIKENLSSLEARLASLGFIRISKSFIVNIEAIDRIVPWFNSTLLLKLSEGLSEIKVTRSYLKSFKNYLNL